MKSIIQEASSVAKAVESAWVKAGKPQQFSIKVFQESEKNFLGITSKPAKIAFLFNDGHEAGASQPKSKPFEQARQRPTQEQPKDRKAKQQPAREQEKPVKRELTARPEAKKQLDQKETIESDKSKPSILWSDELNAFTRQWLRDILKALGYEHVEFSLEPQKQLLKITFSSPLLNDSTKEKHLFRNMAFLMLQSLRREFKRPLRNARIVLFSEK